MKVLVVMGSSREGRQGRPVLDFVTQELQKRDGVEYEVADLQELDLPMFNQEVSPAYNESGDYAEESVQKWADLVKAADAYVIITPEYNHSIPGVLKNALDHLYHEWKRKPVAVVAYSGSNSGGIRAGEHLRQIMNEFHAYTLRDGLYIPYNWQDLDQKVEAAREPFGAVLDDLVWWASALQTAKQPA